MLRMQDWHNILRGNADGLLISSVASCSNLWALIMDAGTGFTSQVYELSPFFLHKEGQGRQNRKLAVAYHRRHNGRSEFIIAQNIKGILCGADDSYVGSVTANLMGSKYHIWDQVHFIIFYLNPNICFQRVTWQFQHIYYA